MNAPDVIEGTAVAIRTSAPIAAPQLLDALRPAERVALMAEISNVIADVIEKKKWYTLIKDKKHIRIEGWTFVGALGGCSAKTVSTEQIDGGFKAHAVVVRADSGIEVGSAEQVCMKSEPFGRGKSEYALIGMASTRACSRALSTVFRHVVELAGYSATPAEEMNAEPALPQDPRPAPQTTRTGAPVGRTVEKPLPPNVQALCDRWCAATENNEDAFRSQFRGREVSFIRDAVLVAENDVALTEMNETEYAAQEKATKEKPRDRQNALAKALFAELGYVDATRHIFYGTFGYTAAGEPLSSWAEIVAAGKASEVIEALKQEKAARAFEEALP